MMHTSLRIVFQSLLPFVVLIASSVCRGQPSGTPTLVVNEFMASNQGSIRDSHGDYDDWIEIYNYGDDALDVGGMYITDDLTNPTKWRIPSNSPSATTVASRGYLLIWADDETEQGPLHAGFKLSTTGEVIGLYNAQTDLIDSVTFGPQEADVSYGRLPDGGDQWRAFTTATPGASNKTGGSHVIISEIMYHPYHSPSGSEDLGQEWIELLNNGTEALPLEGWRLVDGVDFVFPDIVLDAGAYLVVAADVGAFQREHRGVDNVVGGWIGWLSNAGEAIELVDGTGLRIDRVEYADEGDWAQRELGPIDHGHRGWVWRNDHDGGGKSIELINSSLPNEYGGSWAASAEEGGTPGRANSIDAAETAPLILNVAHSPAIPQSSDPTRVSARLVAAEPGDIQVTLNYRVDGTPDFQSLPMFDDGQHDEDRSGDGLYGAEIPPQADGTVVEFYIAAAGTAGHLRTWPAPSLVDGAPLQVTNALYIVDNSFDSLSPRQPGSHPVYYLIMLDHERTELEQIGDRNYSGDLFAAEPMSDAQMNATFISVDGGGATIRYQAGVRNRGNRKRADPPMSYRVNFADDRPWKGAGAVNLNSKYPHLELMASVLFQISGLAAADVTVVRLKVNGEEPAQRDYNRTYGFYSAVEVLDGDWAKNHFPDDDNGNLYRCTYFDDGVHSRTFADLYYKEPPGDPPDPNDYRNNYPKKTNQAADDWSDLFALIDTLNNRAISDDEFVAAAGEVINLQKWTRFLAADALIGNREGGLTSGSGDDYALYCGAEDPRFWLVPHDLDTVLGQGDHSYEPERDIFVYTGITGLRRLLNNPDVIRLYYRQYRDLAETVLAPAKFDPLVEELLAGWVPDSEINGPRGIKQFVRDRVKSVLYGGYPDADTAPQIPQEFMIVGPDVITGYPYTRNDTVSPAGTANAIETRSVRVNGRLVDPSDWSQEKGTWSIDGVHLNPGVNRVVVQAFEGPDGTGKEVDRGHIDLWYDDGDMAAASGILATDRTLDAASGPWWISTGLTVPAGVTLAVGPGTTLFFEQGAGITVQQGGRLVSEGTAYQRIRLTCTPGSASQWEGLKFDRTLEDNRLCCVDMEFGDGQGESIDVEYSRVLIDDVTWGGTNAMILNMDHPTVTVRNSVFPSISGEEQVHGVGLTGNECLVFEGCVFGTATGYNDIIDFSGGQRPGPILQIYDSILLGGGDDGPDLDGADAHIEGNVFLNFHKSEGGDTTSNAIATGRNGGSTTDVCVVRNLFVNNDHAILVKEDGFLQAESNTFVNTGVAAVSFGEPERNPPRSPGAGAYMAGNIFWNNAAMFAHYFQDPWPNYGPVDLVVDNSILPAAWHGLGEGNVDADPLFMGTNDFRLKSMSPARASGSCGLDMGAYVPAGASVHGEPAEWTHGTAAVLTVCGPGITHYKYSLNAPSGPWSEARPMEMPIELTGLRDGDSYTVYVIGKNSAGVWQEQPNASRTWTVDVTYRRLVINEVLAVNQTAYEHEGTFPDVIELYYDGPAAMDLSGMTLSDDAEQPEKFVFPAGSRIDPGAHLVLFAEANAATPGIHVGFGLNAEGDEVYLYDRDGTLVDSVTFGHQLADLSIGRVGDEGNWHLTVPTFGTANVPEPLGDPSQVKLNEWLARGEVLFDSDFIELCNPQACPVDMGGFYLTDNPVTQPAECALRPLTFIAAEGFGVFQADGRDIPGHVDFRLSMDGESIGLFDPGLREIDKVLYGPQTPDVSRGRAGDGSDRLAYFMLPTPGLSNPGLPVTTITRVVLVPEEAAKRAIVPVSAEEVGDGWKSEVAFDDASWLSASGAPGGVGYERSSGYESLISLDVEEPMYGQNNTCYVRIPFWVEGDLTGDLGELALHVRYDDGFVAYLNGTEVARTNLSGSPQWDSRAESNHEASSGAFDVVLDLSEHIGVLRGGDNLLAVQGLNISRTSSDFIISVALEGAIVEFEGDDYPYLNELALLDGLRITELMYHAEGGDRFDYIELQNISDEPVDVTGVRFTDGFEFTLPQMIVAAGERVVVVDDLTAFTSRYGTGIVIAGEYTGHLSDNGEDIVVKLASPLEAAIMRFRYEDTWYPTTDGGGTSLSIEDVTAAAVTWNDPKNWRPSDPSPGEP